MLVRPWRLVLIPAFLCPAADLYRGVSSVCGDKEILCDILSVFLLQVRDPEGSGMMLSSDMDLLSEGVVTSCGFSSAVHQNFSLCLFLH